MPLKIRTIVHHNLRGDHYKPGQTYMHMKGKGKITISFLGGELVFLKYR
jgi:hypothetical protein